MFPHLNVAEVKKHWLKQREFHSRVNYFTWGGQQFSWSHTFSEQEKVLFNELQFFFTLKIYMVLKGDWDEALFLKKAKTFKEVNAFMYVDLSHCKISEFSP